MTWIKICGITSVNDAVMAVAAGADAIGLNFVPSSKRVVDTATAAHIVDAVGDAAEVVAVVADRSEAQLLDLREATGIRWLQLHGAETARDLANLLPEAFKGVAVADANDVEAAQAFGGERLLVDAKVPGELGGTGHSFDWALAVPVARRRTLILAGGLTPANVARAVHQVKPWGVDVASGVEAAGNPRVKDPGCVQAFIAAVRDASTR